MTKENEHFKGSYLLSKEVKGIYKQSESSNWNPVPGKSGKVYWEQLKELRAEARPPLCIFYSLLKNLSINRHMKL